MVSSMQNRTSTGLMYDSYHHKKIIVLLNFNFKWWKDVNLLEGKTGTEIPESSRLELIEKILANNFALSDPEDNTSRPLNRRGIADLPLLRTLLAICQKSREPSFYEVMNSSQSAQE